LRHKCQRTQPYRHSLIRSDHTAGKESRGRPPKAPSGRYIALVPTRMSGDLDGLLGFLFSEAEHQELCHEEIGVKPEEVAAEQQASPVLRSSFGTPDSAGRRGAQLELAARAMIASRDSPGRCPVLDRRAPTTPCACGSGPLIRRDSDPDGATSDPACTKRQLNSGGYPSREVGGNRGVGGVDAPHTGRD
jgi:hypothetical protein